MTGAVYVIAAVAALAGPVGVVAPKALVILVVAGGLAGLSAWFRAGRPHKGLPAPLVLVLAALLAWAGVSALWSADPVRAGLLVLRLAVLLFAGGMMLFAFRRLDRNNRRRVETSFAAGAGAAVAALVVGFAYAKATGDSLWGNYYFDPLTTLNNGAIVVSLLLWPMMAILWRRGRVLTGVIIAGAVVAFVSFLSSGAALLATAFGVVAFFVVRFGGLKGCTALALIMALLTLSAPYVAGVFTQSEGLMAFKKDLPASAGHRLNMWGFVVERIDEKPLWGWGMDGSRWIPQEDRRLQPNMEIMPLHPHNAALQVRLELGLPGAAIAAVLVFVVFRSFGFVPASPFGPGILAGAGTAYMTVGGLSYGVWQNWWISVAWIVACLAWLAIQGREDDGAEAA
ncbi:MAG: O-antigen ligase family protein [Proteobacteria bacterium]|nr:O-antigen ligase family protein [Pseudomonadota bacterium]